MKLGMLAAGSGYRMLSRLILKYDMGVELAAVADVSEEGAKNGWRIGE